jgi:hypothetical protein
MAFVPEGPAVWTFSCAFPSAPEGRTETAQGFSPGKVRGLALPKQDRIMLPVGLDILGRPKGENRIAHGLQPWEGKTAPRGIALKGRPRVGHYSQR